jgi:hypothetical protein
VPKASFSGGFYDILVTAVKSSETLRNTPKWGLNAGWQVTHACVPMGCDVHFSMVPWYTSQTSSAPPPAPSSKPSQAFILPLAGRAHVHLGCLSLLSSSGKLFLWEAHNLALSAAHAGLFSKACSLGTSLTTHLSPSLSLSMCYATWLPPQCFSLDIMLVIYLLFHTRCLSTGRSSPRVYGFESVHYRSPAPRTEHGTD